MNIKEFLIDNYIWILVVILISVITIIGFLADKSKGKEKVEVHKEKKKKKNSIDSQPIQYHEPVNNNGNASVDMAIPVNQGTGVVNTGINNIGSSGAMSMGNLSQVNVNPVSGSSSAQPSNTMGFQPLSEQTPTFNTQPNLGVNNNLNDVAFSNSQGTPVVNNMSMNNMPNFIPNAQSNPQTATIPNPVGTVVNPSPIVSTPNSVLNTSSVSQSVSPSPLVNSPSGSQPATTVNQTNNVPVDSVSNINNLGQIANPQPSNVVNRDGNPVATDSNGNLQQLNFVYGPVNNGSNQSI